MIKNREHAEAVQMRRYNSGKAGVAGAVRRWAKRNKTSVPGKRHYKSSGGPNKWPKGTTERGMAAVISAKQVEAS